LSGSGVDDKHRYLEVPTYGTRSAQRCLVAERIVGIRGARWYA
jgi:hypothetical protein